jgi:apolipoprotein N-acyltransferase
MSCAVLINQAVVWGIAAAVADGHRGALWRLATGTAAARFGERPSLKLALVQPSIPQRWIWTPEDKRAGSSNCWSFPNAR